jgi:hypothetical protein
VSDLSPAQRASAEMRAELASVSRTMAALMADPQSRSLEQRPAFVGRRMAEVVEVNNVILLPLTASVDLDGTVIPGCSPQSTYRPMVGDQVWLEFLGTDPHISPPLTTYDNRRWRNLILINSWTGSPPGYWRDPLGVVHIKGTIAGGAAG